MVVVVVVVMVMVVVVVSSGGKNGEKVKKGKARTDTAAYSHVECETEGSRG